MRPVETIRNTPIPTQKSVRADVWRGLTSGDAGKILPLAYVPLLREDAVQRGVVNIAVTMRETVKTLMNAVSVTVYAHFVPFTAFERFNGGLDAFNRSYSGVPEPTTDEVIPFIETHAFSPSAEIYKTLGVQFPENTQINMALVEAYNTLVNYRYRARSSKLPQRLRNDTSLASAFWRNPMLWHIVPDFEQAMLDGEVPLSWAQAKLPVTGIQNDFINTTLAEGAGRISSFPHPQGVSLYLADAPQQGSINFYRDIYADMEAAGLKISLQNIELAKQTAAFAKMRESYSGVSDEHILDMLMSGLRVPPESMKEPMLLAKGSTVFGYSRRRATDGENLDVSLTDGVAQIGFNYRLPPMNTGGIVLVTAEIVPETLFERMDDHFLSTDEQDDYPSFLRDFLDPEKVDVVKNTRADTFHTDPNGLFGYEPLNFRWKRNYARIGGKYYRPANDAWNEDRGAFWSPQVVDPSLTEDFYLVGELPKTIFNDTLIDPFEIQTHAEAAIVGLTVFGHALSEDEGHYESIVDMVDTSRIDQQAEADA